MSRHVPIGLWLLLLSAAPAPAGAEEPPAPSEEAGAEAAAGGGPALDLGNLLRPRGPFDSKPRQSGDLRSGRDERAWRQAFAEARAEVAGLEEKVTAAQEQIRKATGGAGYNFSPVGVGESVDPDVQRLRAQLKRDRRSLDTARSRLRDLDVEASLAGVPDAWREPLTASP